MWATATLKAGQRARLKTKNSPAKIKELKPEKKAKNYAKHLVDGGKETFHCPKQGSAGCYPAFLRTLRACVY